MVYAAAHAALRPPLPVPAAFRLPDRRAVADSFDDGGVEPWGRYWGWDPKEVWALVTLLVYALPLHAGSLPWFRRPLFFHWFCIAAFLSVLVTYFGVNFLLGGMHSYAG